VQRAAGNDEPALHCLLLLLLLPGMVVSGRRWPRLLRHMQSIWGQLRWQPEADLNSLALIGMLLGFRFALGLVWG